ncbi:NHS actin remodeling regulator GUK-holder isoform X2 [Megalopta genalis]|uniref:NHS actin remodeling regulator GUK-holder isoform X2 n=1 Tax=Megalopta genalis TaxID=115081 RepID=UPI003FD50E94
MCRSPRGRIMPFVLRKVEPRYLCRGHVPTGSVPQGWPVGAELEAVSNGALTVSLKQLASLLTTAENIFADLTAELTAVADRSSRLRQRIDKVEERLALVDPKKIPVPESDICTFSARTEHFHVNNKPSSSLFTSNTRPKALTELYEAAAIVAVRGLDSLRRDGSSVDMFLCTPVLGKRRRDQSLDIESRIPAVIEDLRRWTSTEALGDVTVPPDCMSRILGDTTDDDAVDHKLPSPEEQVQAVALKFPAEIVAVDVSGKGFERMSMRRRSLLSGPENQETAVKRRSRLRRPRGKRRNTIAGTDQKEIRQAIGGETIDEDADGTISNIASRTQRSASTDILGSSKKDSSTEKKSHFNTLKAWGMSRLKLISPKSNNQQQEQPGTAAAVTARRRKDKSHERKPSSSSSSGKSVASIPVSVPTAEKQPGVKLRESAVQRRERRKGSNRDDPPHSSSGNWSASSESGRASIGSETTTTTHQPRSTTTASIGTSSTSLNHVRRFKGRDTSASSSVTSEGTLTPDIIQDIAVVPFSDDGETSSVYSCDTEGYYTSFHVDSGLKTLREEEPVLQTSSMKTNDVSSDLTSPTVENEYELFGRGSTSTTTSSAGTVCTALLAPPPPERKSSLTVVAMVHGQNQNGGESPDSGHNTSSSPVESASSPACTGRSCSEFEYSESSDLEGCERIERIRSKTAINASRIPSMCVITPPGSDDELARESEQTGKSTENRKQDIQAGGSVLMSATVGTSKMEVINGQDKNMYATVQVLPSPVNDRPTVGQASVKINPLSGVLGKLRGVLPGRKHVPKNSVQDQGNADSGDYVTIADVRNNNDKRQEPGTNSSTAPAWSPVLYANSDIFKKDAEYVSLNELPKKPTSSLERKRQGARVTLDSEGKVVYTSDSLKRRKGAHSTFNPGPFVREGVSPSPSPLLHRATPNVRAVTKTNDAVDGPTKLTPPTSPQLGKLIIRAARSPERASSPDYVRTPSTVVGPTSPTTAHRQVRGAYVNMQEDEDNTLLAIDSVPPHGIIQPPSYDSPPKPKDCKKEHKIQDALKNAQTAPGQLTQCEKQQQQQQQQQQQNHGPQGYHQEQMVYDPQQNAYNNNKAANWEYQRACKQRQIVSMHNARNQQYCASGRHAASHQFYTLPSRRPRRDVEPPRSVTPDITRGLGHGSLSAMHMYAMHGQFESQVDLHGKHLEHFDANTRAMANRQQPAIVDVRNRFATPLGLTALGYRFFGSSPVRDPVTKTSSADALQHNPISPTRQSHENSFATSTPIGRTMPTIADRMALIGSTNCPSPTPNSGRSTPTNLVLSPTKSTMSNEELFAAIHKSKKRLNIKDDGDSPTPYGSTKSIAKLPPGNRHSWSSDIQKSPVILQNVQSSSPGTSRLDFKRLLLQQSVKSGPTRLSAAEQLKLSRQQQSQQQQSSPTTPHTTPLAKVLSPRSVWRFQTPRTDVLSSTIIEDTAAEEKAMKPSPENTSPISRLNARRQIDLCSDLLGHLSSSNPRSSVADHSDDVLPLDGVGRFDATTMKEIETYGRRQEPATRDGALSAGDNCPTVHPQTGTDRNASPVQCVSDAYSEHSAVNPAIQYSYNGTQLTPSCQKAINAFESRRISNQLARAQFLAGTPSTGNHGGQNTTYVRQIFRARSESPQNIVPQNVPRSPSAPTLETAL